MSKTLVIVESPGKIVKIGQILGPNYIVKASFGHVQDLDKDTLSIDVENNFKPLYKVSPDKAKVVKELKSLAKECSDVILAADGDREGEAIAYSLASVLGIKEPKRIIFNEITKDAINKAIKNPITINYNMVNAQQARRLLDRLVGYKISPVLWKCLASGSAQSAGRVQSVVVRIIIDKENEINKSISEPYFKTTADFDFIQDETTQDKIKLSSTLQCGNKMFQFETSEMAQAFLNNINKKTSFKVVSVENKKSIRKPSPPFITSSLQQEASTKLHFSVKQTMDIAQKLYEAGHITYMRSDSPNISKDAIAEAKKYIEEKWGKEYSESRNYESKNTTSQDAHECIRPTHIDNMTPSNLEGQLSKLYSLIWKRTIASQMSDANINVQTIQIDSINSKVSCLNLNDKQCYFVSTLENTEFPGYMIVYDNSSEDEDKVTGKLAIKVKDKLTLNQMKVAEEYTKPPLRYNEAALVRYLEKNGIGRPSTYASIISKVIERKYVEINNVEGVTKKSKILLLSNDFKLKETTKDVTIGKEMKKLIPTEMGEQVNQFMMTNFEPIMDIEFTANFESYLDKIAEGNANWVTVLRTFYDMFNPIVEKLNAVAKETKKELGSSNDKLLGKSEDGNDIYCGTGKYGPYVKIIDNSEDKPIFRYAPLKDILLDKVTLEDAINLLEFPKNIGKIGNAHVTLNKGPYGFYFKYGGKNFSIKEDVDISSIDITYAKTIIESGDIYALKTFKVKDKIMNIKNGEFGNYIQIVSGTKKQNISIPSKYKVDNMTIDDVLQIIADKNGSVSGGFTKKKSINI